eukprot:7342449-Prymnesium_polylepis.1
MSGARVRVPRRRACRAACAPRLAHATALAACAAGSRRPPASAAAASAAATAAVKTSAMCSEEGAAG